MPADMIPASANVVGPQVSMPHPHMPGGPWTMLQDEGKNDYGTSNAFTHPDPRCEICLPEER